MSAITSSEQDLNQRLVDALTDVAANRSTAGVHAVVRAIDCLMDLYVAKIPEAIKPEALPAIQVALRQLKALRESIAIGDGRRPTIF